MEIPVLSPWSWHDPKRRLGGENAAFNDAKNVLSFMDGHVNYLKVHWRTNRVVIGGTA